MPLMVIGLIIEVHVYYVLRRVDRTPETHRVYMPMLIK